MFEILGGIFFDAHFIIALGFLSGMVKITKNDKPWPFRE